MARSSGGGETYAVAAAPITMTNRQRQVATPVKQCRLNWTARGGGLATALPLPRLSPLPVSWRDNGWWTASEHLVQV